MIMPGVQKPHWRPCWSQNACWSGWRVAPSAMPSIVLTSAPSAWTASIVQDFALSPLTWTVHAPQLLVSQPMWVPVRPKIVAQQVDEQEPRLDVGLAGLAVDGERDVLMCVIVGLLYANARARSTAVRSDRTVISATIARL